MTIKLAWTRDKNTGSHVLRATQWDGTFTDHVYIVPSKSGKVHQVQFCNGIRNKRCSLERAKAYAEYIYSR